MLNVFPLHRRVTSTVWDVHVADSLRPGQPVTVAGTYAGNGVEQQWGVDPRLSVPSDISSNVTT